MSPRERLLRAWAELERRGAVVRQLDVEFFSDREVSVLAEHAEHRLRVLAEGRDAGWVPRSKAS